MSDDKNVSGADSGTEATPARVPRVSQEEVEELRAQKADLREAYASFDKGDIYVSGRNDGQEFIVVDGPDGQAYFLNNKGNWVKGDSPLVDPTQDA